MDLYLQIHRATRTAVALAKAIDKYDAATEAKYKTQFTVLLRLEEARDSLEFAAGRINEGIAKIIDSLTTLAQLEKKEKRRKREEETQEEKEEEACPCKKIRLDHYKKSRKQILASIQESKALNELKLERNRLPTFRGNEEESFGLYAQKLRHYFDARKIRWNDPSFAPRILVVFGSTLEGTAGQLWMDRCMDIISAE
ncbi:hypothetical protein PsorP6_008027 [Peronosclerospora sorghi]|uniref:Uncharacterized protein n=1 Tax=Peronosclerospora sorghi TaxID=230839 RepID=A0ACC0WAV5_9STRA|nr:hypothetical protein PsorP6_008027 [Peronosclerospora sorghi]